MPMPMSMSMHCTSVKIAFLFVLGSWALPGLRTSAQAPSRESFQKEWDEARRSMERERWDRALDQLRAIFVEHARQDYVLEAAIEIRDAYRRCAFLAQCEDPDPAALISGELVSWSEKTGKIQVRYGPEELADFKPSGESGKTLIHPALFRGPYTVEVKGSSYPGASTVLLMAGLEGSDGYAVGFGARSAGRGYIPPRLLELTGGESQVVDEKARAQTDPGKPFAAKVVIGKNDVAAYFNNRKILFAKRKSEGFGQCGLEWNSAIESIELRGEIETAWLQGLVSAAKERAREEFLKTWKEDAELPDWLLRGSSAEHSTTEHSTSAARATLPGRGRAEAVTPLLEQIEREDFERAEAGLETLSNEDADPALQNFLWARFHEKRGELAPALKRARASMEWAPENVLVQILQARLAAEGVGREAARAWIEDHFQDDDKAAGRCAGLAQIQLLCGDLPAARDALDKARRAGAAGEEVDRLDRTLVKAMSGPHWAKSFESDSAHFLVRSDIDQEICSDASRVLEEGYRAYGLRLGRVESGGAPKFPVYLFSGEAGYQSYVADVMGARAEHTAGLYHPVLRQLLIWNLPDRDQMMHTIRHEGFHQYLDRRMDDPPRWFNEGSAEYYEIAGIEGGRWKEGQVNALHAERLRGVGERGVPLADFLRMSPMDFYRDAPAHYAQAWAFVHYLKAGRKDDLYERFFNAFQDAPRSFGEDLLASLDLAVVEREFWAHIDGFERSP